MAARSRSGAYANITQSLLFRSKRLGGVNCGWDSQPKQWLPLCDYSFRESSQGALSPKIAWSIFSQSHLNENRPRPKAVCWKEFHDFLLPRLGIEITFLWLCQNFIYHSNFVWQHFQVLLKYTLYGVSRLSTLRSRLLCWFARAALPQLWETAQLKSADASCQDPLVLFTFFEQVKYNVSCWCPLSQKSPLCGGNALHFSRKDNNFGPLFKHKMTVILHFTELSESWMVQHLQRHNSM